MRSHLRGRQAVEIGVAAADNAGTAVHHSMLARPLLRRLPEAKALGLVSRTLGHTLGGQGGRVHNECCESAKKTVFEQYCASWLRPRAGSRPEPMC